MILLLDIGNSRIKWAHLVNNHLSGHGGFFYRKNEIGKLLETTWSDFEKPEEILVSNVAGDQVAEELSHWALQFWQIQPEFVRVTPDAYGVTNAYPEYSRLGIDRWLALIAVWRKYRSAACIVDCGTAVTVDGLDGKGMHLGGLIMPGILLMQQSLYQNTKITGPGEIKNVVSMANTTEQGIQSGCKLAVVGLIEYVVNELQNSYDDLCCVITGGNAEEVKELLDNKFIHEPHIVLEGLSLMISEEK